MLVDHALQSSAPTRANRRNQPTSTARLAPPMTSPTGRASGPMIFIPVTRGRALYRRHGDDAPEEVKVAGPPCSASRSSWATRSMNAWSMPRPGPSLCRLRLRPRGSEGPLRQPRRDQYGHRAR